MKAFALTSPDQPASLVELPDPEVPVGGLRLRVRAAGVNGFDVFQANGYLLAMMEHQFPTTIGRDFAGVAEAVGAGRTDFAVGDEVFGFASATPPLHAGTYAELLAGGPDLVLARKPAGLSFAVAAALPLVGATALAAVDAIEAGPCTTVLVVGATGGVGSLAVQLAVQRGASVIATAKAGEDEAFVRELGAVDVIDYTAGDVAALVRARFPAGIDALIDLVNRGDDFTHMTELVRDGGRVATTMSAADVDGLAARGIRATNVPGKPTPEILASLAGQVVAGTLRVEVQQAFPPAALTAFMAGTRGKLVLAIGEPGRMMTTSDTGLGTDLPGRADPVERVAAALRSHNIEAIVVESGDEARQVVLGLIPAGAEVHSGKSKTLEDVGLYGELVESGRYDAIRPRMFAMDRKTQGREIRKLVAAPDFMLGSVAAVTEDGTLVAASATGSQLGAYAAGGGRVILVVGSQKIVPDLDAALRRIHEVVFPYENAQVRARLGVDTSLQKVLVWYGEWQAGRTTVVLVREPVGV